MGHTLTVESEEDTLEQVEFCQHKVFVGQRVTMCPNPWKVIPKTLSFTGKVSESPVEYLRTVCRARAYIHNSVPVLGPLFHALADMLGEGDMMDVNTSEFKHVNSKLYHLLQSMELDKLSYKYIEPTEEDRHLFAKMWKVDVSTQAQMENLRFSTDFSGVADMLPITGHAQYEFK